ncbi:MAG: AEC family transporter [Pseudoflavonifractor sp.]
MLTSLLTVASQVLVLFLMMGVGFVLGKLKKLAGPGLSQMSTLLLYVVAPCVIMDAFQQDNPPSLQLLAVGLAALSVYYLLIIPASGLLFRRQEPKTRSVLQLGTCYPNASFMGLPLLQVVLGPSALVYGVISMILFTITQWVHGTVTMGSKFSLKQAILNPGVIGLAMGLPLLLFGLKLPLPLRTAVSFLADMNTPLAMVVIGGQMATADFVATFTQPKLYSAAAGKLLLLPALIMVLLLPFHLDPLLYCTCVILAATPTAGVTSIFAQRFGQDTATAAQLVTLCTLLSILTMPIFAVLAQMLCK